MKKPYDTIGIPPPSNDYQDFQFKREKIYQFNVKNYDQKKSNFKLYIIFCLSVFLTTSLVVKLIKIYSTTTIIEKSQLTSFMCDFNNKEYKELMSHSGISNEKRKFTCDFLKFLDKFNKNYNTINEKKSRFEHFLNNIQIVNEKNNAENDVVFKINKYADWSDDELRQLLMSDEEIKDMENMTLVDPFIESSFLPIESLGNDTISNFDWREKNVVTAVKDQGKCGSCAFFANVAVIESANAIKGEPLARLSEQELLDCDKKDNGCNGANRVNIFKHVQRNGIVYENYYQYKGEQKECRSMIGKPRVYISGYKYLGRNEDNWIRYLKEKGPFSVGVQVPKQMYYYSSGVFNPTLEDCKEKSMGSHAMAVVGYGEENGQKYWLLKNSWGQGYGIENGFIKMRRGVNSCGIANYAYGVEI
ncbi:Cathepsin F [Strongyloides ratti]|uniref:Cathepsin F n=1 Tax=Strongyloides ratti TaxID=34506 RepID=A0A090L172_STRRB|nr:Cathepsin F [Strongyloides ratti]CEF63540.1 Cathepsin F [Strongyloides ratti]